MVDLHEIFPEVRKKTLQEVYQPWIAKWGIDDVREFISSIEQAGYSFVDTEQLKKTNEWMAKQRESNVDVLEYLNRLEQRNKTLNEVVDRAAQIVVEMNKNLKGMDRGFKRMDDIMDTALNIQPPSIFGWLRRLYGGK